MTTRRASVESEMNPKVEEEGGKDESGRSSRNP